jgi:hypothetical protein
MLPLNSQAPSLGTSFLGSHFFRVRTMQKHHITASTLSHHDNLRHTVRNHPTPQKPSQIENSRCHTVQGHIQDHNIPSAIALIRHIFQDRIPQPLSQFCFIFRRGATRWEFDLSAVGKLC